MKGFTYPLLSQITPHWFAVASPGLQDAVAEEFRRVVPGLDMVVCPAGVEFATAPDIVRQALPWLRVTTRVWRRVAQTKARAFGELERKWADLPWADYVTAGSTLRIDVAVAHCRLFHSGALKERLKVAVGQSVALEQGEGQHSEVRLLVRGEHDVFQVSVDASGDRLNVRGYRQEVGKAPLRETLAAGMLSLCGWTPNEPLVDPMCGSGTVPIEAALGALSLPSGDRDFAMDLWPCFALGDSARDAGVSLPHPGPAPLLVLGADRDALMVERAKRNAARARVDHALRFETRSFAELLPPAARGLLLFNPPYGHRIGSPAGLTQHFEAIGRTLAKSWGGWRAGILLPKGAVIRGPGLKAIARQPLSNGGLPVELVQLAVQ